MKQKLRILIVIPLVFFSCGQGSKSTPAMLSKDKEAPKAADVTISQKSTAISNRKSIDTIYVYADDNGKSIIIENGLPKGGSKYTDPNGAEYGYAVFWTRIINKTDNPLELEIDFLDTYEVPSFPGKYFKILVPPKTMTTDKEYLFNYGLTDLDLDNSIDKPTSLKRTINPKESNGFYVVKLSLTSEGPRGGGDILRTGLTLKGQDLFYNVSVFNSAFPPSILSEKEIHCGKINLKNLKLQQ